MVTGAVQREAVVFADARVLNVLVAGYGFEGKVVLVAHERTRVGLCVVLVGGVVGDGVEVID